MPDFTNPQSIYLVLALVVPGLIITYVRAQFITGRLQNHADAILSYFALSSVYGAIVFPILEWLSRDMSDEPIGMGYWFGLIFVGPVIFGAVLGLISQTGILRSLLHKIGISPVHTMPTAWDWKFGALKENLVIVTLKDDTRFAGYCGRGSFMSSDPTERDIYVEKIYAWGEDNSWNDTGEHGLWVASGEIRSIEFFPASEQGVKND
ncbi:MAG: DUF6338 family protein [Sulfitobacter sp.]